MEPTLHIRLLGDFSAVYADRQVTGLNTARLQSLLAYLVLHRDVPQQRQHLAFLFWPDTAEAQALASAYLALLMQLSADETVAREYAEQALAFASKYQASYYRAWTTILVSYALASEQPDEAHIGHLRDSITEFKAPGARLRLPYYLSLLAQVYGRAGRADEGLAAIDEALTEARTYNERWWDAEVHRLRGELLLIRGADASDAEAAFLRASEIAQSQQARSLELRVAMSLARLWRAQNRSDDARSRLGEIYNWFAEGFETPNLQAARLLLAEL